MFMMVILAFKGMREELYMHARRRFNWGASMRTTPGDLRRAFSRVARRCSWRDFLPLSESTTSNQLVPG